MLTGSEGLRLRVFVHEHLRYGDKPAYAAIVELARREGMAGATVFRGTEGFGLHRHLHTARLVDVADDLPLIVEIVDATERIRGFAPRIDDVLPHYTATFLPVRIVKYAEGDSR
jgi:PII-like signaling protein